MKTRDYLQTNRTALFDWIVLITSFLLGFAFPSLKEMITSRGFHLWMLAPLLLYTIGAALKHLPLSYRLAADAEKIKPVPYIMFLVTGHWFIILILAIFSGPAFRQLLQMPAVTAGNAFSGSLFSVAIIIATGVTWLVYRNKTKIKKRKNYSDNFLFRMELIADILLIAGVAIFSFIFWEKGVLAMLSRASTETMSDIWFLFVFLSVLFVFFYLPLRYLFFIEDRGSGRNRRRLLIIFGFMLLKALLETLAI